MRNLLLILLLILIPSTLHAATPSIQQYDLFELTLPGPSAGNPFLDTQLSATFTNDSKTKTLEVPGFYDGNATYKIRYMPELPGPWHYTTHSNAPTLDNQSGNLNV